MNDLPRRPVDLTASFSLKSISLGMLLFVSLACIYLLIYRGHPLSIDEISTLDSVESFTQHGTFSRTIEFYREPTIAQDGSPFLPPLYEPLQIVAASPFYLLAQRSPFGQFQTVFLLNIFVTALTALSLYVIALTQGYGHGSAWMSAFLYGTATLALPYSRWFFREPLMALFALWAFALAFEIRVRLQNQRQIRRIIPLLVGAVIGMILTKQIGIVFIPGLALCLFPPPKSLRRFLPVFAFLIGAVLLLLLAIAALNPDFGDDRYSFSRWLNPANLGLNHILESLLGYQFSPARSIWLYSPILLFGFAGIRVLLKRETKWLVFGVVLTLAVTSAAYGALRLGAYWSGGWNWGPRYMLPLIPLWMLFVLPVVETLSGAKRSTRLLFRAAGIGSFLIQIAGIAVPYTDFYNRFYPSLSEGSGWLPENWSLQNTAIVYHVQHLSLNEFDNAWRFADQPVLLVLLFTVTLAACLAGTRYILRSGVVLRVRTALLCAGLCAAVPVLMVIGLASLQNDSRYIGSRQDVVELINRLNQTVDRRDVVFLSGSEYMILFMNAFKAGALFSTLPDDAAGDIAAAETLNALEWAARRSRRIWLVMSPTSYLESHPQNYRRWLSNALFPIEDISISPFAHAALFVSPVDQTLDTVAITPAPVFGEQLALRTAELPVLTTVAGGDIFTFALHWTPVQPVEADYHVSIQALDSNGVLIGQRDSAPLNGYGRTSTWEQDTEYRDPYAIQLPAELRPGEYRIQVVVYRLENLQRLQVQAGADDTDSFILTHLYVR